ncbi:AAA family ATPase [Candidatus Dojkabacteria bacterium]|nr:AAA family ATPase [Candidatus Dojkabacteria bacterium]
MNKKNTIDQIKSVLGFHSQAGAEICLQICPFCGDDKHHLYLNVEKLVFNCFKCNETGTIRKLVKEAGITFDSDAMYEKTNEIKRIAAEFFADRLVDNPSANDARKWLKERGINEKWLRPFQTAGEMINKRLPIGFHPGDNVLLEHFDKLGFSNKEIYESGILIGKYKDFNGSVVFPYHISTGVIGRFKLRKVRGTASDTIWLGEKDTQAGVFGLNLCPSTKEIICVEGEFDALALQILGLMYDRFLVNVLALSGGASGNNVEVLYRNGARGIHIIPDSDKGGFNFVTNCLNAARRYNLSCIVYGLDKKYKDLDELIQSGNHNLKAIFDDPMVPGEYLAKFLMGNEDFSTINPSELEDIRQRIVREAGKLSGFDKRDFITTLPDNLRPIIDVSVDTIETLTKDPISAKDLLKLRLPRPAMIIGNGLLPRHGYTILASTTKMGKTTMSLQMCLCIVSGTPFLVFPIENQVGILYCDFESTKSSLATLLRKQIDNLTDVTINAEMLNLLEARGLCLESKNDIDWLISKIDQTNAGLVVLDPISLCVRGDINDIRTVRMLVQTLQKISKEMNNSWFMIHHYGKETIQKRQPIHAMLGSSGWGNYTESFVGMERYSDRRPPDYKRLTFNFRLDKTPGDLCAYLNPTTRLFELVENPEDITAVPIDRIGSILQSYDKSMSYGVLVGIVTEELGVSDPTAKRLIMKAKEQGIIKKEPGKFGKYYWKG